VEESNSRLLTDEATEERNPYFSEATSQNKI
jgi:hypothetical protein